MSNLNLAIEQNLTTVEDFAKRTFLDTLDDILTDPEDLVLYKPDSGYIAQIRDGMRIREDFRKAFDALDNKI